MQEKILIANRGEIAARIIRTCRKMNIPCAAVFSEADRDAPYVSAADESYEIGGPRPQDSYLNSARIIETAKAAGCTMIHPGYGFLSENADFARSCEEAGIRFIGPPAAVIEKMGDKVEARKTMERAGLPLIPGLSRPLHNLADALAEAERIGYPVMLKASAGGGGIGMQAAAGHEELQKIFESTSRKAENFFGKSDVYLEKLIARPRHIEIQILASNDRVLYLWDRECSIQRRHQKVLEEAPSPFLYEDTRRRMGEAAASAAAAIGYENAGTFEFLVDEDQSFYFLEMNTRLQVEHPVTEEITGLDLVEWQIRTALGENLPFTQEEIMRDGHAVEVRIYAEDPVSFYPSPGNITNLSLPEGPHIRHELGVHGASAVTPFYDPMISKLIVSGSTREEAVKLLQKALGDYEVEGIKTNLPLLRKIAGSQAFLDGDTTTGFITESLAK